MNKIIEYQFIIENMKQIKLKKINFADQQFSSIISKQKTTLDRLNRQNNDSRNLIDKLIEQGSGKTKFMISSEKELVELEDQLRKITIRLDGETKKNELLKELVNILNNEDKSSMKQQLLEANRMISQREKKLKKQQYDIEQILQKHNEVIAKINILKQQTSGSRRERVVYSNLFKKIEKQIKVYEESYKEILLQSYENQKKQKLIRQEISSKKRAQKQPLSDISPPPEQQQFIQTFNPRRPIDIESIHVNSTSPPPSIPKRNININKTSAMMDTLNQYKLFFDILKCQTGEQNQVAIIDNLPKYGLQNQQLTIKIEQLDNQIIKQGQNLKYINNKLNHSDCLDDEQDTNNSINPSMISLTHDLKQKSDEIQDFMNLVNQISLMLNIPEGQHQVEVIFQLIQNKLSLLNPEQKRLNSQTIFSKKLGQHQTHIQNVIEKMQAYDESQKILSKHFLQTQSIRELSRHKRLTKSRK